jgi:hypothetical protein
MKLLEVLRRDVKPVSEEQVILRLQAFDWRYEFADDFRRISAGQREMQVIENIVYQLWKINPARAVQIWNEHCPYVHEDKSRTPSFIYRLQSQDENVA